MEWFQTDLQLIFGMLQYKNKKEGLKEYLESRRAYFEKMELETYQAVRELLQSEKQLKEIVSEKSGKETVNMCKALEELYNNGINEGIHVLIKTYKEFGLSREDMVERIMREFSVTREKAEGYLKEP